MSALLAVDPGTTALGWAWFTDGRLYQCSLLRAKNTQEMTQVIKHTFLPSTQELVIERPQLYVFGRAKADPNKVAQVTFIAGVTAGRTSHGKLFLPYPGEWKGQVPKSIHNERVLEVLEARERAIYDKESKAWPASLRHNILDAIGLGLWHLRRIRKCN